MTPKYLCLFGVACKHIGMKTESNSWLRLSWKKSESLHRLMDVNTEQWTKSQGDCAVGLNSLATAYAWIPTQVLVSWRRVVWGVSDSDRHGVPPRTLAVKLSIETHLKWLELALSVITVYLKYQLNFMIHSLQKIDVLWGNSQKQSGGNWTDLSWPKSSWYGRGTLNLRLNGWQLEVSLLNFIANLSFGLWSVFCFQF